MMLRLIFIIGCVWNSTPKYTPNYWDSKRHLETFTFTLYCNLHLIISRLQFYDILWKYKFESPSLHKTLKINGGKTKTSPVKSRFYGICHTLIHDMKQGHPVIVIHALEQAKPLLIVRQPGIILPREWKVIHLCLYAFKSRFIKEGIRWNLLQ